MKIIWATRGKDWGFRFLAKGGHEDPLLAYEEAFETTGGQGEVFSRSRGVVALRFPDPEGRKDAAGRIIPHDIVIASPEAETLRSVEDGRDLVWPLIAGYFEQNWSRSAPRPTQWSVEGPQPT